MRIIFTPCVKTLGQKKFVVLETNSFLRNQTDWERMDELASNLNELRITHEFGHIDSLISKLKESSYVGSATRGRVVELIRQEVQTPELAQLDMIFSQSTDKYIPRAIIRKILVILEEIKKKGRRSPQLQGALKKEEWFCLLVDSDEIIPPFRIMLDRLFVCRYNVISPLFTIVLFGKLEEDKFFADLLTYSQSADGSFLVGMTNHTAKSLFKYYGGVEIEGSSDSAHLMQETT